MPDLLAFLLWYLVVLALGLAAWPLAYRFLPFLPGRGWALSKAFGLLVAGYAFWLLGTLGFLRNSVGGILFAFGILVALSVWSIRESGLDSLRQYLVRNSQFLIVSEAIFFAAFALWAYVRAHNPEIVATEKPMEFAFLNAIDRSDLFPPLDPWLSGYAISYYYFGYVIIMMLAGLTGVPAGVAFNLGVSLLFGLVAVGAWGIVCDLIEVEKEGSKGTGATPPSRPPSSLSSSISSSSLLPALLGPLFVLFIGNFGGFLEVLHSRHAFWPQSQAADNQAPPESSFWKWVDLEDLDQPPQGEPAWLSNRYLWWWRSSRVVRDRDLSPSDTPAGWQWTPEVKFLGHAGRPIDLQPIDEFPMFSFLLGDLHPHVLALPFVLLTIAFGFNLLLRPPQGTLPPVRDSSGQAPHEVAELDGDARHARFSWLSPLRELGVSNFVVYALVLGGLSFLNTWDFPIYLLVSAGAYVVARSYRDGWRWAALRDGALLGGALLVAGVLLYLPFYLGFQTQAGGLLPNFIFPTRLPQFFIMFGPLLTVVLTLVLWLAVRHPAAGQANWLLLPLAALFILGPLVLLTVALGVRVLGDPSLLAYVNDFLEPISIQEGLRLTMERRLTNSWTALLLLLVIGIAGALLAPRRQTPASNRQPSDAGQRQSLNTNIQLSLSPALSFTLLLTVVAALLTLFPEFLYLRDNFGARMNTIFKFYYQAWLLWGLAAAFGAWYLSRQMGAAGRAVFQVAAAGVVAAGLIYPVFGVWTKANGFSAQATLDGFDHMASSNRGDYDAIRWLNDNIPGSPVIAEAIGGQYSQFARVSASTGLPTVLGWGGHEGQWRGSQFGQQVGTREPDIETLYRTRSWQDAETILDRYDIRYVYFGSLEASQYGLGGAGKFGEFMTPVYEAGGVTIYERQDLAP